MTVFEENLQSSVFDRLIDLEPDLSRESKRILGFKKKDIRDAVVRDLENLFNTRRRIDVPSEQFPHIVRSLFAYGLRDFSSENPKSIFVRQRLRQEIEETIERFEPRIKNVVVRLDSPDESNRAFRFRIKGFLEVEPLSEPVVFDTYFDVNRGEYVIEK